MSSFFFVLRHTKQRIVHHDKHPVTGTVRFSFLLKRVKKVQNGTTISNQNKVLSKRIYTVLEGGGG